MFRSAVIALFPFLFLPSILFIDPFISTGICLKILPRSESLSFFSYKLSVFYPAYKRGVEKRDLSVRFPYAKLILCYDKFTDIG